MKTVPFLLKITTINKTKSFGFKKKTLFQDFPGGLVVRNLPANAGDTGLISGPGRSHMPQSN